MIELLAAWIWRYLLSAVVLLLELLVAQEYMQRHGHLKPAATLRSVLNIGFWVCFCLVVFAQIAH